MELKLKPYAYLAAFGAYAVSAGALGLYGALLLFNRSVPLGGIDRTQAAITAIALAVPFTLIIAIHVVYARILLRFRNS